MRSMGIGLAIGAALASSAGAQMSYSLGGFTTQLFSFDNIRATELPDVLDTLQLSEGAQVFGSDLRTFQRSFVLDAEPYPTIVAAQTSMVVRTQAAPNRFEVSWDSAHSGEIMPPAADVTRFRQAAMELYTRVTMTMTENTTLRVSWQSTASGILGGGTDIRRVRNNAVGLLSGTALDTPFSFGYGAAGLDRTEDFSFELNVLPGRQIALDLVSLLALRNEAFPEAGNSWDQASTGSFIVEVVPAPAPGAVLALGLFGAARRRR